MKVFVISEGETDSYYKGVKIMGAFSTEEKAWEALKSLSEKMKITNNICNGDVYEFTLDKED